MIVFRSVTKALPKIHLYQQIRTIPRWSSRTPKRVYMPEDEQEAQNVFEKIDTNFTPISKHLDYPTTFSFKNKKSVNSTDGKVKNHEKLEILTLRKGRKKKEIVVTDMLETVIDAGGNLIYTKMENNDGRISKLLSNLKSEKALKKEESILLEGKRLIQEALKSGCKLQYLLFSRKTDIDDLKEDLPKIGAKLYKMPYREIQMWSDLTTSPGIMGVFKIPPIKDTSYDIPVNIICDNIREPGNLGSILRTCAAAGCKKVILTKGCCDVWSSKVLRSATGAHFKLKIVKSNWDEIKEKLSNTNWFIADNKLVTASTNSSLIIDLMNKIPVESYDKLKYSNSNEISLVIGGETEGVSEEAYSILESIGGMRLNIPLGNNIESLNSGTALAVLIFEIRRQMTSGC